MSGMSACWPLVVTGAALATVAALMVAAVLGLAACSLLEEGLPRGLRSSFWFCGWLAWFVAVLLVPGIGPLLLALALLAVARERGAAHREQDMGAALAASLAYSSLSGAAMAGCVSLLARGAAQVGCAGRTATGPAITGITAGSLLALLFVLLCTLPYTAWLACFPHTSTLLLAMRGHAAKMSKSVDDDGREASSNVSYEV